MTYNLHPIFVHFPIAMLLVYSVIKLLPLAKWFPKANWKDIELALLFIGVVGSFFALATGETAEHLVRPSRDLVEAHSLFATISTWIYGALLLGEVLAMFTSWYENKMKNQEILKVVNFLKTNLTNKFYSGVLSFLGLIAISLTGLLGGVITYGVGADPFAAIVLQLLGISIK